MKFSDLIKKKQLSKELNWAEIKYIVTNYSNNKINDKEMLQLINCFIKKPMTKQETINFFQISYEQAQKIDLSMVKAFKVDKHSTGGIGDKVTLLLIAILDALNIKMVKFSGGRLGFTGGTIEKLKSFPNIKLKISVNKFQEIAKKNNILISYNDHEISKFEKKLYDLRNKSKKTNVLGMIVNSVMIKKIILQNDGLIVNVNFGSGAFCKSLKEALIFSELAGEISEKYKRKTSFIITTMDEPLGMTVGNKIEIIEVINYLENKQECLEDLKKVINTHVHEILLMNKESSNMKETENKIKKVIQSGLALKKFRAFVERNEGDFDAIYQQRKPQTKNQIIIKSNEEGYLYFKSANKIGTLTNEINLYENKVDYEAGIKIWKKNGDFVQKNELIATIWTNHQNNQEIKEKFLKIIKITSKKTKEKEKILKIIRRF